MIEKAIADIHATLSNTQNPVIACSFGKDSMLLLELVKRAGFKLPLLSFNTLWSKASLQFVADVVKEGDYIVYSYQPERIDVFETDDGLSAVSSYSVGGRKLPVISDFLEKETICGYNVISQVNNSIKYVPSYLWNATLTGSKQADTHTLIKKLELAQLNTESHQFITPLWKWTDADVWEAIRTLGVRFNESLYLHQQAEYDTANFHACGRCYQKSEQTVLCPKTDSMIPTL